MNQKLACQETAKPNTAQSSLLRDALTLARKHRQLATVIDEKAALLEDEYARNPSEVLRREVLKCHADSLAETRRAVEITEKALLDAAEPDGDPH